MGIFNIFRALLIFVWACPFLVVLLRSSGHWGEFITYDQLKILFIASASSSLILFIEWFLALRVVVSMSKAFSYLRKRDLVKLDKVLSKIPINKCFEGHKSLLQYAVDNQMNSDIIGFLLYKGALISYKSSKEYNISYTLFYLAAYYDHINVTLVSYLLTKGAYKDFIDNSRGFRALSLIQVFVLRCHFQAVELLIRQGATLDYVVEDLDMNTLMLVSRYVTNINMVKLIAEHSLEIINKPNTSGMTPILFAAEYNRNPDVITTLVELGAKVQPVRIRSPHLTAGGNIVTPLRLAVINNSLEVIATLIELGDDPTFKDSYGFSIIFLAAAHNKDLRVIELLLANGATIEDSYDIEGNTPLMGAAYLNPNIDVIRYLIQISDNPLERNRENLNFVDYLKENTQIDAADKQNLLRSFYGNSQRLVR